MVTKEEVKNSVEFKWRGQQWRVYLGLFAFMLVLVIPMSIIKAKSLDDTGFAVGVVAVIYGVVFVPFVLYAVWRQRELVHRFDNYERHQVKLDHPSVSRNYRGAIYYVVLFQDNTGEWIRLNTKPLFSGGMFAVCPLEKYNNQTVEIFYDSEKEQVILSKLV